jgi:hypothetical protein
VAVGAEDVNLAFLPWAALATSLATSLRAWRLLHRTDKVPFCDLVLRVDPQDALIRRSCIVPAAQLSVAPRQMNEVACVTASVVRERCLLVCICSLAPILERFESHAEVVVRGVIRCGIHSGVSADELTPRIHRVLPLVGVTEREGLGSFPFSLGEVWLEWGRG